MEWKLLEEKKFAWPIFDQEMQTIKIINKMFVKQKKEKFKDKKILQPIILWQKITQKRLNKCERNFTIR